MERRRGQVKGPDGEIPGLAVEHEGTFISRSPRGSMVDRREDDRMEITVRPATLTDAAPICAIYNQGIEDRVATLETDLRTPEERWRWLADRGSRYPVIVAEAGGQVVGWGSLNPFNPRRAYDYVADFSVYVERGWRGKGVGSQLLPCLMELAREHGFHKLVLSALPWNEAGMALYRKFGFSTVGIYKEMGQLDGKWVDTIIMEKILSAEKTPTEA
jgi:phosphinothricin acetyltransferase